MAPSTKSNDSGDQTLRHALGPRTKAIDFMAKSVLVKVGKPAALFHVDEVLLQENSEFFAAALKKEWREGQRRVVELPEEEPRAFNTWLNWLYCRRLYLATGPAEDHMKGRSFDEAIRASFDEAIRAYALGSVLLDTDFVDAVCDALTVEIVETDHDGVCIVPDGAQISTVYEETPSDSMLRKLLVYRMATLTNAAELLTEDHDSRFLLELAKFTMGDKRPSPDHKNVISAAARCEFHKHTPGAENCYRTKYQAPFCFSG